MEERQKFLATHRTPDEILTACQTVPADGTMLTMLNRSPSPGLDPWLEESWGDVNHESIGNVRRQIVGRLPSDLFAAVQENVYVIQREEEERHHRQTFRPDGALFARPLENHRNISTVVMEPDEDFFRTSFSLEPFIKGFIEIGQLSEGNPLVTAIDVLSPMNKSTAAGKKTFLKKRQADLEAEINVVETDLLRSGDPLLEASLNMLILHRPQPASPYRCYIRSRDFREPGVDILPISLRQRLPRINIPVRPGDPAVVIDLQEPIDQAYQLGSYGKRIDYAKPQTPMLPPAEAEWAAALVQQPAVAG